MNKKKNSKSAKKNSLEKFGRRPTKIKKIIWPKQEDKNESQKKKYN